MGNAGVRTVCRQANKIRDFCAFCVRLNEELYFSDKVFWKQILHKSIINLCYALSSIAAELHWRPVLIGRPWLHGTRAVAGKRNNV